MHTSVTIAPGLANPVVGLEKSALVARRQIARMNTLRVRCHLCCSMWQPSKAPRALLRQVRPLWRMGALHGFGAWNRNHSQLSAKRTVRPAGPMSDGIQPVTARTSAISPQYGQIFFQVMLFDDMGGGGFCVGRGYGMRSTLRLSS